MKAMTLRNIPDEVAVYISNRASADRRSFNAAAALETGSRLLSYDAHFDHVAGLIRLTP